MQPAHDTRRRRASAGVRRLIAGGVAALLGLGPGAGTGYAQKDAPPSSTPAADQRAEPSIEEVQRRARPFPIPTRDASGSAPTTRPGHEGPEQRVPGRSGEERDDGIALAAFVVLTAVGGLVALAVWVYGRPLLAALRRRRAARVGERTA